MHAVPLLDAVASEGEAAVRPAVGARLPADGGVVVPESDGPIDGEAVPEFPGGEATRADWHDALASARARDTHSAHLSCLPLTSALGLVSSPLYF